MTKFSPRKDAKNLKKSCDAQTKKCGQKIAEIIKEAKEQGDLSETRNTRKAKRQQSDNERGTNGGLENDVAQTSQLPASSPGKGICCPNGIQMSQVKCNGDEQDFCMCANQTNPIFERKDFQMNHRIGPGLIWRQARP